MKKEYWLLILPIVFTIAMEKLIPENYNGKMTITIKDIFPFLVYVVLFIIYNRIKVNDKKVSQMRIRFFKKYGNNAIDIKEFSELYNRKELKLLGFNDEKINKIKSSGFGFSLGEIVQDAYVIMEGE